MKELFKTLIADFHEKPLPTTLPRDITVPQHTNKIISIVGPRRAGKTHLAYHTIAQLNKERTVYINFADERIHPHTTDLQHIITAYTELYPEIPLTDVHFFFDEIHEVQGWSKFVRRIHETTTKHIYVTGSSAKLLSKEIATQLRGRTLSVQVLPLSFKEFLRFTNTPDKYTSTKEKARIAQAFSNYLTHGGYPEIALETREDIQTKILQNYFEVMIYRDIIERHSIQNQEALKKLALKGINNLAKEFSIHKTYNDIKSEGLKVSKNTLYEFITHIEDAYLLILLKQFLPSQTKQNKATKKAYGTDTGLANALSFRVSENIGRQLENAVHTELLRREQETYFHKRAHECDFLIKEKNRITHAIQVTTHLHEENQKRELAGLKEAMNAHNLAQGTIITLDQEDTLQQDSTTIRLIPAWKWLLTHQVKE